MTQPTAVRFFSVVQRPSILFMVVALLVLGFGAYVAFEAPADFEEVAVLALFLQMFAASTGYRNSARRGHFDPILVGRSSRTAVARAHWLLSVAVGLATWLAIAAIDVLVARPGRWPAALTGPGLTSFLWVSTAAWTMTLPFNRLTGGALWILVLLFLAIGHEFNPLLSAYQTAAGGVGHTALRQAVAALVLPFLLVAEPHHALRSTSMVVAAGAGCAWGLGWLMVSRFDATLADTE